MQAKIDDIQDIFSCDRKTAKEIRKMVKDLEEAQIRDDIRKEELPY